jgi:hypothetical protein
LQIKRGAGSRAYTFSGSPIVNRLLAAKDRSYSICAASSCQSISADSLAWTYFVTAFLIFQDKTVMIRTFSKELPQRFGISDAIEK